ncbi:hypothetical protein THAOC_15957 [Thalassiosira oceanica]|uniref:Helicase-associated domain-containing protein n=1 Tax=Thalassiosira oceanica TaxID=159749 RepID=K0SEG4_THAOC|nr:hypothetical protein THAOC_15957 [Thalassiosira oceanica]|eukprot:EJK63384.1 hypothetical protein THAOC_15957 [Thalassiosira oceanica]
MSSALADYEVVNTFLPWAEPKNFPGLTPLHSRNNSPSSLEGVALKNFFPDKNEEGRDEMSSRSEDVWLRACELLRNDNMALRNFFADNKSEEGRDEMSTRSEDAWLRACELLRNDTDNDDESASPLKLPHAGSPRAGSPRETDAQENNFVGPGQVENEDTRSATAHHEGRGELLLPSTASVEDLFLSLTDEQKKILGDKWLDKFGKLRLYNMVNKTCDVRQKPRDGEQEQQKGLGQWVNKQRNEKKKFDKDGSGSMTELRIELLESIGFTWAKAKGDDCWNERFNDLAEYKKLHNHCDVKTKGDVQGNYRVLGRWVTTQRALFKRDELPDDKVAKLTALGFRWKAFGKGEKTRKGRKPRAN